MKLSISVEITMLAPNRLASTPASPPQSAPATMAAPRPITMSTTRGRSPMPPAVTTAVPATAPTRYWPSPPMVNTRAL